MNKDQLVRTARAMVAPGKGILAADESTGTIAKRFAAIGVDSTQVTRRDYRQLLFSAEDAISRYISGVILFDETDQTDCRRRDAAREIDRDGRRDSRHQGRFGREAACQFSRRNDHRRSRRST